MSKEEDSIRLVVMVTKDSHPELFDELYKRERSYRAERIRTLATLSLLGVQAGRGGGGGSLGSVPIDAVPAVEAVAIVAAPPVDPEVEARAREERALEEKKRGFKDSVRAGFRT